MKPIRLALIVLPVACLATAAGAQPVAGGFHKAPVDDAEIKAAADFAVSAAPKKVKLAEIVSASQQVVAGMNYSLCLRVKGRNIGQLTGGRFVAAKVFRGLDRTYRLTSWQIVKTCN